MAGSCCGGGDPSDYIDKLEKENERLKELDKLHSEEIIENKKLVKKNKELIEDYKRCVGKFDDCRATIAWAVNKLGGDASRDEDDKDWHETLIKDFENLLEKND